MLRTLHRFTNSKKGTTAIEFALVVPAFLMLIVGILEFTIMLYMRGSLEHAIGQVARKSINGASYHSGLSREESIDKMLDETLGAIVFNKDNLKYEAVCYNGFNNWNAGITCGTAYGGASDIVEYTVYYKHEFITPLGYLLSGENNSIDLMSTFFVQTERF